MKNVYFMRRTYIVGAKKHWQWINPRDNLRSTNSCRNFWWVKSSKGRHVYVHIELGQNVFGNRCWENIHPIRLYYWSKSNVKCDCSPNCWVSFWFCAVTSIVQSPRFGWELSCNCSANMPLWTTMFFHCLMIFPWLSLTTMSKVPGPLGRNDRSK